MTMRKKISLWAGAVCLVAFAAWAANPSFSNFITTQFAVDGNLVKIKSGATVTNINANGASVFASQAAGTISSFSDNNANTMETITDAGVSLGNTANLTLLAQTANTMAGFNASKNLVSFTPGSATLSSLLGTNVTSITVPMGAWFVNNVGNGADITNAVALSITNSADGWTFVDAQTNAIATRLALPQDWDCSPLKVLLRCTTTGGQTAPNTNVVFDIGAAMIGHGDREDNASYSTQWVTNGLSPTAYIQTVCVTKSFTPGGTLQPTNSIVFRIKRIGAATGDTAATAGVALAEVQVYFSRTNRNDFPVSSP